MQAMDGIGVNNNAIHFDIETVSPKAIEYFIDSCGMYRQGDRFRKMRAEGLRVKEKLAEKASIRAVLSKTKDFRITDEGTFINDRFFQCCKFNRSDVSKIEGFYMYALTGGDFSLETDSLKDSFYADVWGTCYVEAGREELKRKIQSCNPGKYISAAIGPGVARTPITEIKQLMDMLDCATVGMSLTESGMILPIKSSAGFFVVSNEGLDTDLTGCKVCMHNDGSCEFCHIGRSRRKAAKDIWA